MNPSLDPKRLILIGLLVSATIPYFINLGASSLWDSNEAFYAQTPREMIASGDYVSPTFNYQPRFNKPPLVYWVVAIFYRVFGMSEAVERLPIALGALALILTALGLGWAAYSTNAGFAAAIAVATSLRFLMFSRRTIIDIYLAMFMCLALLMFILSQKHPHRRRLYLSLMYVAVGLGILTKGPVAAILPAAAIVIYLALYRRIGEVKNMMLPAGLLIVLAIVIPWYVAVYFEHGWYYIRAFLIDDNLSRYTQPVWGPRRGILFYLGVVAGDFFPWSLVLPSAIWALVAGSRRSRRATPNAESDESASQPETERAMGNLLLIWIAVILVFFSLSSNKEDLYVLPVYAAAAALVGGLLFPGGEARRATSVSVALIASCLFVAAMGVAVLWTVPKLSPAYNLSGVEAIGYVAVCGGLLAAAISGVRRKQRVIAPLVITLVVINWIFVLKTLPDFEKYKPVRPLCDVIVKQASPDARTGYYRFASPSMVFYLQRPIFEFYRPEQLIELFSAEKEVYCVMTALDYEAVRESLPAPTIVLATRPTFQVKLKGLLSATESPQVVLISNKLGVRSPE